MKCAVIVKVLKCKIFERIAELIWHIIGKAVFTNTDKIYTFRCISLFSLMSF